jgi:hypothetical protein
MLEDGELGFELVFMLGGVEMFFCEVDDGEL